MQIIFNEKDSLLRVYATLDISHYEKQNNIMFLFNDFSRNMTVNSPGFKNLDYNQINDTLIISLPHELNNTINFKLNFKYEIPFNRNDTSIFLYFWYPYLKNNLSAWNLNITIPSDFSVFCPGKSEQLNSKEEYNTYKIFNEEQIPNFPMLIINSKSINKTSKTLSGIRVNFNFKSGDSLTYNSISNIIFDSFNYYSSILGKYRYSELNLVEVPGIQYANSQPSTIFIGDVFISYFNKGLNGWPAHEIAHQWIGSGLFVNTQDTARSCIFEPLAEFLKLMYIESIFGFDSFKTVIGSIEKEYNSSIAGTEDDIPLIYAGSNRVVYLKGPLIMNLIRNKIGNENWLRFLKTIYTNYKGKFFTYNDFIDNLKYYDSDASLIKCINSWVTTKGLPEK